MCEICGVDSDLDVCKDCETQYPDLDDHAFSETLKHMDQWVLNAEWEDV